MKLEKYEVKIGKKVDEGSGFDIELDNKEALINWVTRDSKLHKAAWCRFSISEPL